ncbi:MAG: hypothetical protein R3F56_06320 [Planctomycetota bacterium]
MNSSLLPFGLVVCAVAGAVLWFWPTDAAATQPAPAPAASSSTTPEPQEAPALSARWTAPAAVQHPSPTEQKHMVKLPTGEWVKALNGAVDARITWPSDRPFSPIIGVERASDGKEWWVHADGTKSTTEMVYRSDLGRHDGLGQIANPVPPLPMEPEGGIPPRSGPGGPAAPGAGSGTAEEKKK